MKTIAGIICCRNTISLDYCWEEAGAALLEVCSELVLCDSDSTDGTRQAMDEWQRRDSRINICNFPWPDPRGDKSFYPSWVNYARMHAKSEWVVCADADEIIHENSYQLIRDAAERGKALKCRRLNFWRDPQHLIPEGFCCGTEVIRVGSAKMFIPSDYPDPRAAEICNIAEPSEVTFYHYGFIRKREAFFRKAREVHRIWHDSYDPRLEAAEKFEGQWSEAPGVTGWEDKLVEYHGTHPKIAHAWLRERGYSPV